MIRLPGLPAELSRLSGLLGCLAGPAIRDRMGTLDVRHGKDFVMRGLERFYVCMVSPIEI